MLHATFTHGSELHTTAVCPQNRGDVSYFSPTGMWKTSHLKDLSKLFGLEDYHLNNCPLRLLHKLTYKLKHSFSNLTSIILTVHTSDLSLKCYNVFSTFLIEILGLCMH